MLNNSQKTLSNHKENNKHLFLVKYSILVSFLHGDSVVVYLDHVVILHMSALHLIH